MLRLHLPTLLLLAVVASNPLQADPKTPKKNKIPKTAVIRPGIGLGEVSLGDKPDQVEKVWGKADATWFGGTPSRSWRYYWAPGPETAASRANLSRALELGFNEETEKLEFIAVLTYDYAVEGAPDLKIGAAREKFVRQLHMKDLGATGLDVPEQGINFEFDGLGSWFWKAFPSGHCQRIFVYEKGHSPWADLRGYRYPDRLDIRPGQGLGDVSLGDSRARVEEIWGKPKEAPPEVTSKKKRKRLLLQYCENGNDRVIEFELDKKDDKVVAIGIFGPRFKMADAPAVGVGAARATITKYLGTHLTASASNRYHLEDNARGIFFNIQAPGGRAGGGKVDCCLYIGIFKAGQPRDPYALLKGKTLSNRPI